MGTREQWTVEEVQDKVRWEGGWYDFFCWSGGADQLETDDPEFNEALRTAGRVWEDFRDAVDEMDRIAQDRRR